MGIQRCKLLSIIQAARLLEPAFVFSWVQTCARLRVLLISVGTVVMTTWVDQSWTLLSGETVQVHLTAPRVLAWILRARNGKCISACVPVLALPEGNGASSNVMLLPCASSLLKYSHFYLA